MLILPDIFRRFSFTGIDPGLEKCGVSSFIMADNQIESIDSFTLTNNRLGQIDVHEEYHKERVAKMHKLCAAFDEHLRRTQPVVVVSEAPFFNPARPGAFGSLTETIANLRNVTYDFNPCIPFVVFAPQEVKQSFKRSGQKGKDVMAEGLMEIPELHTKLIPPIGVLDEHAIDAIAVGYTWWKLIWTAR